MVMAPQAINTGVEIMEQESEAEILYDIPRVSRLKHMWKLIHLQLLSQIPTQENETLSQYSMISQMEVCFLKQGL